MKELTFDELIDYKFGMQFDKSEKEEIKEILQQVREATKAEAVNINNEVVLFNMGIDLESDVGFRDANDEILSLPTDRIKTDK